MGRQPALSPCSWSPGGVPANRCALDPGKANRPLKTPHEIAHGERRLRVKAHPLTVGFPVVLKGKASSQASQWML